MWAGRTRSGEKDKKLSHRSRSSNANADIKPYWYLGVSYKDVLLVFQFLLDRNDEKIEQEEKTRKNYIGTVRTFIVMAKLNPDLDSY
jgi:hypothetical protein